MQHKPETPTDQIVACPQCNSSVVWNESSEWRPFCSQRCKQIDLGEWFNERYTIAGQAEFTAQPRDEWDN